MISSTSPTTCVTLTYVSAFSGIATIASVAVMPSSTPSTLASNAFSTLLYPSVISPSSNSTSPTIVSNTPSNSLPSTTIPTLFSVRLNDFKSLSKFVFNNASTSVAVSIATSLVVCGTNLAIKPLISSSVPFTCKPLQDTYTVSSLYTTLTGISPPFTLIVISAPTAIPLFALSTTSPAIAKSAFAYFTLIA